MKKIQNRFAVNYVLMLVISTIVGVFALMLAGFADDVISKNLIKNNYTAMSLMQSNFMNIDTKPVVENGGGIQVIDSSYRIVLSKGIDTIKKSKLTTAEFTEFLTKSKSKGIKYSYDIKYNEQGRFWLVVTFPTSFRIDFQLVHNPEYKSVDTQSVVGVIVAIVLFYLLLLAACTVIYSKLTSIGILNPLKKLTDSAKLLRDGEYSTRVDLNLQNEFGELQDTFNSMAQQIEKEILLRKQSEESRKRLVLDISHDLKNPLSGIMGYAEQCLKHGVTTEELQGYARIIYDNSVRANNLITDLFELSKMESSEYVLNQSRVDFCEYLRETMGGYIENLEDAGFEYDFDIPEGEIIVDIDRKQMDRLLQNLIGNAVKYNPKATKVVLRLEEHENDVTMIFKDNGIGIPRDVAQEIFKPFVRVDRSRNSQTGGTGLGLAIVQKIVEMHGGSITLNTSENQGCEFVIVLKKPVT